MVRSSFMFIALATYMLIASCDAHNTVESPTAVALESSHLSSNTAVSSSQTKIVSCKKRKCIKVRRCPKNEEFSFCIQSISRAQYCSQKGQSLWRQDYTKCMKGCVCKANYLRNNNGTCIKATECNTDCGENEILDECPSDCPTDYCPTKDGETTTCFQPDQDKCPPPVCKCGFNKRRAENGTCISTIDCRPFNCSARPNEEFNPCPPLCPTDDCSQATPSGSCPPQFGNILIVLPCNPKCTCIKGYWRKDGICVPYEECPGICPVNEEYSTCTAAVCRQQNCSTRNDPVACLRLNRSFCKTGCVCKQNYYRNENGICVSEDQCNDEFNKPCDVNEVLDDCPSDCISDYCPKSEEDNKIGFCAQPNPCPPPKCKCKFNYRRALNGTCIPTVDCPPFDCSENEQYTPCPPICPSDSCSLPRVKGRCPFRIGIRLICNPKCQCKDGYGRLENGKCVPFEKCPNLCPPNEEYNSCTQAICRPLNCTNKSDTPPCSIVDKSSCNRDCVCKENYYRNEKGVCVTGDKCTVPVCPNPHEVYKSSRIPHCPLLGTCTSITARIACDKPEMPSCICDDGYLRLNETSYCIPTSECPQLKNVPRLQTDGS